VRFNKPVVYAVVVMLALFLSGAATQCRAAQVEFEGGAQILRNEAPAFVLSVVKPDFAGDADLSCGLVLTGPRDTRTGIMGVRCEVVEGLGRLDVGIGAVYFNKTDELNGSQLNYSLLLRYNITDRWAVSVRHFSNAGTTKPNTGRDLVLISYRF
jgi:hypothetical protein